MHRSRPERSRRLQGHYPPRTTVEETVLDLTQTAKSFDDVCGWVTRAIARELTDETRLHAAMTLRPSYVGGLTCMNSSSPPQAETTRCWNTAITETWNERMACLNRAGRCRSRHQAVAADAGIACTRSMG